MSTEQPDPIYDAADAHVPDSQLQGVSGVVTWGPDGTYHERHVTPSKRRKPRASNRTAWTVVVVVALVALLIAVVFYAKQSRDREDRIMSGYTCELVADSGCVTP
jgi:hypothetical protein